jgi:glycosyltransferase involved in cell wall biosynthesis
MTRPNPPSDPDRPLRIGALVSGLAITGGLERCVLEDTRELLDAGHEVQVWHRDAHGPRVGEGRPAYERMGVELVEAADYRFGLRTALRDVLRFAKDGLRLRRAGLDVLWLNRPEYLPYGRVVSAVSRIPLAVHLHHAPNYGRIRPLAGGRTRFLAVSHAMARAWAAAGAPVDKITVVPNGVDTADFPERSPEQVAAARAELGIPAGTPVVLYYGRLSRSKGVVALLEAWQGVLDAMPAQQPVAVAAACGIAGAGGSADAAVDDPDAAPERPAPLLVLAGALYPHEVEHVEAAVDRLPEGSVLVLPERDDVVPLLHAADLVVAPSIEPEGFGRTVVEAMSTGVPAVAAASGGTGEILSGEWARFTVDPADADALARTIVDALDETEYDPTLGARCRSWVRERYGREPHVRALLAALASVAR